MAFLVSTMMFTFMFYSIEKAYFKKEDRSYFTDKGKDLIDDEKVEEDKRDKLTFVLYGIDEGGLSAKRGVRSDTIMLIDMDFDTGQISALGVPRDTRVKVGGKFDKINHAHSIGGVDMALDTLNDFLDLDIENYVRIDFEGVMKIVDAIGGVEMDVPVNMDYDDPTAKPELHIHLKKGPQLLDGKNSHDVVRFRHNNGQDFYPGGYTREQVQQMWLEAFAKSALSAKNILKLPKIIETTIGAVDTNIAFSKIVESGLKANKLNVGSMNMTSIPVNDGSIVGGVYYYLPDEEASKKLANEMFGDDILSTKEKTEEEEKGKKANN